jgi:hypothetical protein
MDEMMILVAAFWSKPRKGVLAYILVVVVL